MLSLCLERAYDKSESGDLGLLERVLNLQRESISLCEQPPKQIMDPVVLQSNHGVSLWRRYDRLGQREDLDEAIKLFEGVLNSPPPLWVTRSRDPAALERLKDVKQEIASLKAAEARKP
ncbi:hypothetical protein NEOLEDRAFT_1131033 [Neolentinus lepideus HHB14362 ss-1]|uniref:Uncharacterized protein n=1 Tax=Neolentinus lepideus HHB14362 ss-1 TaxID=1314782 RepID=A0A165U0P5_9AGAM|nr:hypothetical protein NEOLEDRAFT_1131033 [Neolentinus lepideus HHB14362 ss-1]